MTYVELSGTFHAAPEGSPLILAIHGSASTKKQWRALSAQLEGAALLVAPDLPGYGSARFNSAPRLPYLAELLSAFGRPAHLVAHSFGGAVALRLAQDLPNHVASLTLYDPLVIVPNAKGLHLMPLEARQAWDHLRDGKPELFMAAFLDFWSGQDSWANLTRFQRDRLMSQYHGVRRDLSEVERGHWSLNAPAFAGPLTVLRGALSPKVTGKMADLLALKCLQIHDKVLQGLGHLSPLTDPAVVADHFAKCLTHQGIKYSPVSGLPRNCAA